MAEPTDVFDRIVERNRLLWLALSGTASEEERRAALERAFSPDPFKENTDDDQHRT